MKVKRLAALFSVALIFAVTLTACGDGKAVEAALLESSKQRVVIEATGSNGSLEDALAYFKEEGELDYAGSVGEFGFYLTALNGYEPDGSRNEFWAIYTTLGELDGVAYSNIEYGTYSYEGKTLASASYGISGIPLVEGELYILVIESY